MKILGIETSCDETGVAIYDAQQGLLAHKLHSQIVLHQKFGGVVPELAARDHVAKALPLIKEIMIEAKLAPQDIDGIAYTAGPGLVGALLVGAMVGSSLAFAWGIPSIGVHHMEAHLLAVMLEHNSPQFPFIALLVSGGHTLLIQAEEFGIYKVLGESVDDAVGEAFDKVAKMLDLPYPGGSALASLADEGDPHRFIFPRPMTEKGGLDFSFSGLKTFARNTLQQYGDDYQTKTDIACAFQKAAVDTLVIKCRRALAQTGLNRLVIAGGVGANRLLRNELKNFAQREDLELFYPRVEFCTDNGAMIAYTGCQRMLRGQKSGLEIAIFPRWPLDRDFYPAL